jgi:Zn-dependent protease
MPGGGTWWVTEWLDRGGPVFVVSWVVWVIGSICLHELSHGWAAIRHGDRTPIETGHMTWNPLVHMGIPSLVMFALVGLAWGAMPVNPSRMRGRYAELKVAAAGPLMNIGLALVAVAGAVAVIAIVRDGTLTQGLRGRTTAENFLMFFVLGAGLNIALAVFNLLPIPPLDGWRIVGSLSRSVRHGFSSTGGAAVGLTLLILVFLFGAGPLFRFAFGAATRLIEAGVGLAGLR